MARERRWNGCESSTNRLRKHAESFRLEKCGLMGGTQALNGEALDYPVTFPVQSDRYQKHL